MFIWPFDRIALFAARPVIHRERKADRVLWLSFSISLILHLVAALAILHLGAARQVQFFILVDQGEEALEMEIGGPVDSTASLPQNPLEIGEKRFEPFQKDLPETPGKTHPDSEDVLHAALPAWTEKMAMQPDRLQTKQERLTRHHSRRYHERAAQPEAAEPKALAAPAAASAASREGSDSRVRGVRHRPQMAGSLTFIYPRGSRRRGEKGTVVILATIDSGGRCTSALVERSSGFPDLDVEAARKVRQARFEPGRENGIPIAMTDRFAIEFQLR